MRKWIPILMMMALACSLVFAGCLGEDDDTDVDGDADGDAVADGDEVVVDGDEVVVDGDEVVVDGDEVVVDGDGSTGPAAGEIGAPCTKATQADDCDSLWCLDKENISPLLPTYEGDIPDGYCSVLMCKTDGSDNKCTDAMQAYCFSLYPFAGDTFASVGLCARTCETDADCRPEDDQVCLDTTQLVAAGMDQAVYDQYYPGDPMICLPASLAQAAAEAVAPVDGDGE